MSSLLKEKRALAKLREELEGRKGKLCRSYKGFGHLARNCRNRKEGEERAEMPQNKFEILRSQVMQCSVEERVVRGARREVVRCFKCREKGHKCRECPLWEKKVKRVVRPNEGKAHQKEKFVGGAKEESRVVLWTNSATRCRIVGVGMARTRSHRHVFEMLRMWRRRMPCGR